MTVTGTDFKTYIDGQLALDELRRALDIAAFGHLNAFSAGAM